MSKAVKGDPQIDVEAQALLKRLEKLDYKFFDNLTKKMNRDLARRFSHCATEASYVAQIKDEQSDGGRKGAALSRS